MLQCALFTTIYTATLSMCSFHENLQSYQHFCSAWNIWQVARPVRHRHAVSALLLLQVAYVARSGYLGSCTPGSESPPPRAFHWLCRCHTCGTLCISMHDVTIEIPSETACCQCSMKTTCRSKFGWTEVFLTAEYPSLHAAAELLSWLIMHPGAPGWAVGCALAKHSAAIGAACNEHCCFRIRQHQTK